MAIKDFQEKIGPMVVAAAAGAAVLAIVGFNWGGWVTGETATEMSAAAVTDRLVPICVSQFNADPEKSQKLAALREIAYWKRSDYVIAQGWATMPGADGPESAIAQDCLTRIIG